MSKSQSSEAPQKAADFFQNKSKRVGQPNLDLNDETSIEASSLSGDMEVHE